MMSRMPLLTFIVQILSYSLLPLFGVLFFDWDWRQILILFWLENITVGVATIIGMARSTNTQVDDTVTATDPKLRVNKYVIKLFFMGFFMFHYGIFTIVHGVFVFALASGQFSLSSASQSEVGVDILPLIAFWLLAFVTQVIRSVIDSPPTTTIMRQLSEPYRRVLPLHFGIVIGAFVITLFDIASGAVIVLILAKVFVDVKSYLSMSKSNNSTLPSSV